VWATCLLGIGALAVAYAKALGTQAGLVLGVGGLALATVVIVTTTPLVRVDSRVFRAGRARLPLPVIGAVIVADRAATAMARGPHGDTTAHMVTAIGVAESVVIEVCDPRDPHRTWLVSSRRPADLARAVRTARGKVSP
jgi:hypothetical protein